MTNRDKTMRELIDGIESTRATLDDSARQAAVEKLHARGKLSARERLARLIDKGSFTEIGGLVAEDDDGSSRARAPADGVIVGTARIDGRPAMVLSQDFSVFGGSIGKLGSAKTRRAVQIAVTSGMPLVFVLD